jgi:hypothetical protein
MSIVTTEPLGMSTLTVSGILEMPDTFSALVPASAAAPDRPAGRAMAATSARTAAAIISCLAVEGLFMFSV